MDAFIRQLFSDPQLLRMGHDQREADLNLGLGWLYYSLGRMLRPRLAVVIGSYRGFVPTVMAKGLLDNVEGGELLFIDPSLADDFWTEPAAVTQRFGDLGTPNVRHVRHTTQSFVTRSEYAALAARTKWEHRLGLRDETHPLTGTASSRDTNSSNFPVGPRSTSWTSTIPTSKG